MAYRILIADDEPDITAMLTSFFTGKGYQVSAAADGESALKQAARAPDIILLDINMPGMDGLEVSRRIRDQVPCPILFLTARIEDTDKVQGFAAGGDDYIVKPFSLAELEARETAVKFSGDLTIDFAGRRLSCQGSPIALTKKEFDIIALLAQNPGQIFDRERIYERIWGYDSEGDSSVVSEHIRRIRAKIAEHADRTYIGTVWGCGYKWIG